MYNKEGKINFEVTPYKQIKKQTNISFYNTDKGTADLVINLTRNSSPLLIGVDNDILIKLKNKNDYIIDTIKEVDHLNGQVRYTIPNDFLSLTGNVDGQIYIAVNGKEDIITFVEFSFEIKDALINTIPAVDKLREIRTFQDFRQNIMGTIKEINDALANGNDYVTLMESTKEKGLKQLNESKEDIVKSLNILEEKIQNDFQYKETNLTNVFNQTTKELQNISNEAILVMQREKVDTLSELEAFSKSIKEEIEISTEDKINKVENISKEALQAIETNDVITKEDSKEWAKYKLVENDGSQIGCFNSEYPMTRENLESTLSGFYYSDDKSNNPDGSSGFIFVLKTDKGEQKFLYSSLSKNNMFISSCFTREDEKIWENWENIDNKITDTEWQDIVIKNNYKPYVNVSYKPSYRVIDYGNHKKVYIRIAVTNLLNQKNIVASIPEELNPYDVFGVGITDNNKTPPKVLITKGNVEFHPNKNDNYTEGSYIIYQGDWVI